MAREPRRVDRGRGDDDLEVRAAGEKVGEVAEEEVDVEAALVGLVDDEGVVRAQLGIVLDLGEQDPVGHDLDECALRRLLSESHLVTDDIAQDGAELLGDAFRYGARRDASRLRVPDLPSAPAPEFEGDLGDLGGLSRSRLSRDDHHLVVTNRCRDVLAASRHRQVFGERDGENLDEAARGRRGRESRRVGSPSSRCGSRATLAGSTAATRGRRGAARGGHVSIVAVIGSMSSRGRRTCRL